MSGFDFWASRTDLRACLVCLGPPRKTVSVSWQTGLTGLSSFLFSAGADATKHTEVVKPASLFGPERLTDELTFF